MQFTRVLTFNMPKTVKKTGGMKKRIKRKTKKNRRRPDLRGGGIFDSIKTWVVKTAIKTTPVANMQRGLQARVYDPKTRKSKPISWLPKRAWREAAVNSRVLDKYYFPKGKW